MLVFESTHPFIRLAAGMMHDTLDLGVFWAHAGESHTWPVRAIQIETHSAYGSESRLACVCLNPRDVKGSPIVQVHPTAQINPEQADGNPKAMGLAPTPPPPAPTTSGGVPLFLS